MLQGGQGREGARSDAAEAVVGQQATEAETLFSYCQVNIINTTTKYYRFQCITIEAFIYFRSRLNLVIRR